MLFRMKLSLFGGPATMLWITLPKPTELITGCWSAAAGDLKPEVL